MPLVVPGITSTGSGDKRGEWMSKLMGKKLSESSSGTDTFPKSSLPKKHRVVEGQSVMTMDHDPERLNVHVDQDGTVKDVNYG